MKSKDIGILIFSISLLIIPGCLELEVVDQPTNAEIGSSFSSNVMVEFIMDGSIGADDDRTMLFAVNKPSGWTIDSITYVSPEYGTGYFNYLGNAVDEFGLDSLGGIDVGWEDSVEAFHPSADGMHWQMYVSDKDTISTGSVADPDSFLVVVNYTVDNTVGSYLLKYYTTHSNNGDEDNEGNIAMDSASTVAYDPDTSNFVTFTVVDNSWSNTNVMYKGTATDWATVAMYDDGTNGDATADDHTWTVVLEVAVGDHQWGAIEDDGSANGIWLIDGDNPAYSVSAAGVTGTTSYTIDAYTATASGTIVFTIHDGTESYVDIEWKGTPTNWALVQMYDDGTNGDATADDHIWTVSIDNITAGDHNWGAVENDGSANGIWLISGDNPAFNLEDDLLTYHGHTSYVIPAPSGEELVTFTFNDNSWLVLDVMFKGTMSNWAVFQAYDDGTNGDVTADDHIWTAQYLTANGEHEWGAISTENPDGTICVACDGSDGYGTWLLEGGNLEFSLVDGEVTGVVDYEIPADMAVSEGSVMFTVHDGTESYLDIEWKGTPNGWDLVQMYDDGTNGGDETADDHVWTVIVSDITAGDHSWGAVENDGTEFGEWLIAGGNPVFNLESDLLTLHGSTDYEIPAPTGPDVTKTVLFNVDMTEWLDEEGKF